MSARVESYIWDYRTAHEVPGAKIITERNGMHRYLFIPDEDIYGVAVALVDFLEEKQK